MKGLVTLATNGEATSRLENNGLMLIE